MILRIELSPLAQTDLKTITRAIAGRHGVGVADRAFDRMAAVMAMLAEFPQAGRPIPQNPAVWRYNTRHARIIYRVKDTTLEIVAVIATSMSFRPGYEA